MEEAGKHSGIGVLSPLVGYHLRRAFGAFVADYSEAMDGTGMRQVLVGILAVIANKPGINQGAAGRILGIKRANMVSLINELVAARLVVRIVDAQDRRAFSLNLTEAGQKMLDDCHVRIQEHEARMLSVFNEAEIAQLRELLGRIDRRIPVDD